MFKKYPAKGRILSFRYAFEGIWTAFTEEPNLKFHFLIALIVILLGYFFQISKVEWFMLIVVTGLVISVELTNTAIETVIDSLTQEVHPAAKKAKDVSAGAVLIVSIAAAAVGLIIFLPYFMAFTV